MSLFGNHLGSPSNPPEEVFVGNGSAAAPSLSFGLDPDTGLYIASANNLGFSTGGTQRAVLTSGLFEFSNSTQIAAVLGSNTAPGYAFFNDLNTGLYSPGADIVSITAGGLEIARFQNGATDVLEMRNSSVILNSDGSAGAPGYTFANDVDTGLYRVGSNQLGIAAGGVHVAQFTATGSSDGVQYQPFSFSGGSGFGGSGTGNGSIFLRTTASVSTTPTIITGSEYGFIVVNGVTGGGAAIFTDFLLSHYNSVPTLVTAKNSGGPAARTYALSGDQITLAMGSGTYNIAVTFFRCQIR